MLVVARPPAREAVYHRFENELFDDLLTALSARADVKVILLPRTEPQRADYESRKLPNMIIPREALDGANLIAAADLVVKKSSQHGEIKECRSGRKGRVPPDS